LFESVPYPEIYTIPAALPLLAAAFVAYRPQARSSRPFLPSMLLVLAPSTLTALRDDVAGARFSVLVAVCLLSFLPGFRFRLFTFVVPPGGVLLLLFSYRALGLLGNSWLTLAIAAFVLLVVGSLFEKMRARVRAARTYLAGLR
jgi:cell division protein FtsW (lipid II flippase)